MPESLARALKEKKPILLALLRGGEALRLWEVVLNQPEIESLLRSRFIPIRLERDQRPDLYHRYSGRGPVLMLSADGEVVADIALAPAQAVARRLSALADSYVPPTPPLKTPSAKPVWTGAVGGAPLAGLDPQGPAKILSSLKKRPTPLVDTPGALELLLYAAGEWKDKEALRRLIEELTWLVDKGFWDRRSGAFLEPEKTLAVNAAMARLYWNAYAFTRVELFQEVGKGTVGFLLDELYDEDAGAFKSAPGRSDYYADGNALAASALLHAAPLWEEKRCRQAAEKTLIFLENKMYDPLLGIVHSRVAGGPLVYGLLGDNAWTMLAFTEAFQSSGKKAQREFADVLIRFLFQELWERERGGFLARIAQTGDLEALKNPGFAALEDNAAACEGLWRMHHLKGNANYRKWLEWALKSLSALAPEGFALAPVAKVQDMMVRGRLYFELVGRPGEAKADSLLTSLHRHYVPRKIISFIDPDDQDYILAHKLKAASYPCLFGCVDLKPKCDADCPERVSALVSGLTNL